MTGNVNIIDVVQTMHEINDLYQQIEETLADDNWDEFEKLQIVASKNDQIGEITARWI